LLEPDRVRSEEGVESVGVLETLSIGHGIDAERSRNLFNFTLRRDETGRRVDIKIYLSQDVEYRDRNEKHSICTVHSPNRLR